MSFSQFLLLKIPTIPLGIIIVVLSIAIAVGVLLLVRRFNPIERMKLHHDVAGPLFSTVGVIYAVLLAFMVVIVWQSFDDAKKDVITEATHYTDLYRDASGFPEPQKSRIRASITEYVETVVEDEWPKLAWGESSERADALFADLWDCYLNYEPQTESQRIFFSESVRKLNEAGELRTQRIEESRSGMHRTLWFILLVGGLITLVYTSFFGSENYWAHLSMTTLFAILIGLLIFITLVLDYPFTGEMSISSDHFNTILSMVNGT